MKKRSTRKNILSICICLVVVAMAGTASAFTAPASGDLGYDFYDFATKLSTGAPAMTVGLGGIAMAGLFLFKQQLMPACASAVGVITILKATSILTSLGCVF